MKTENPRLLARLAGVFFLLTIIGGIVAQAFVSERLVNFGDAAATSNNILANRGLFQIGFTVYLLEMACQVVTAALIFLLLRPVNRTLAFVMLLFEMAGIVIKTFSRVFYITPLWVLDGGRALSRMDAAQLQSTALVLLKVNDLGAATAVAFFGFSTSGIPVDVSAALARRTWDGRKPRLAGIHLPAARLQRLHVRRVDRSRRLRSEDLLADHVRRGRGEIPCYRG
jgi:hypothetical protein